MGKIVLEIKSEEYSEEHREKYSESMEDWYEFFIEFMSQCSDAQYLTGPRRSATTAPEPSASL